jgi:small-conductance mechanosensitive channel
MAKHVVAGIYARESFPAGTNVKFGQDEGTIQAVRAVNTAIETTGGKTLVIPNGQLMESTVHQQS